MRKYLFILTIFLIVLSVVLNLSIFDIVFPGDFRQGAYHILLEAEEKLKNNKIEEAIRDFKIAIMRANRCGRKGVSERIKIRLATAGKEKVEEKNYEGAKLFYAYALLQKDFEVAATKVEAYLLKVTKGEMNRFQYPIIIDKGKRNFWLELPKKAPIFLYRKLDNEFSLHHLPGALTYLKVKDLPKEKMFSKLYPVHVASPKFMKKMNLIFESFDKEEILVMVGTNDPNYNYKELVNEKLKKGNPLVVEIGYQKKYFILNSIIVFSNKPFINKFNVFLERKYEKLL